MIGVALYMDRLRRDIPRPVAEGMDDDPAAHRRLGSSGNLEFLGFSASLLGVETEHGCKDGTGSGFEKSSAIEIYRTTA
jgi:hypothetical protein